MASLSPLYTLAIPLVLVCSLPLSIFALITSTFALFILICRVVFIYAELAFAIVPYYIALSIPSSFSTRIPVQDVDPIPVIRDLSSLSRAKSFTNAAAIPARRRRRPSSASIESLTPVASTLSLPQSLSASFLSPTSTQRDFEGVGGWRQEDLSELALWTSINSRLELPADHSRRHKRTLTGGSASGRVPRGEERSYSPELLMMGMGLGGAQGISPNTSRARTPPATASAGAVRDGESYFAPGGSPRTGRKGASTSTVGTTASGSSGSSKGGSGGNSLQNRM